MELTMQGPPEIDVIGRFRSARIAKKLAPFLLGKAVHISAIKRFHLARKYF